MTYYLDQRLHYVSNALQDQVYIVSPEGRADVINSDALDLLASDDPTWQCDLAYTEFLADSLKAGWLVSTRPSAPPIIRRISTAHHLKRIQYEINLLCNLECAHCYCSSSPRASRGQTTAFVAELIRQAGEMGVLYFDFTGGEPLARPDLFDLIPQVVEHGMVPGLFTNGTLVTPAVAQRVKQAGVAWVRTSLDACTPELHDQFRGRKGAFQRTISGIRALQDTGVPVTVTVAANRRNAHELKDLVSFLTNEIRVGFALDRVIPSGRAVENSDSIALSNKAFYELAYSLFGTHGTPLAKICESPNVHAANARIEPSCGVGVSFMFIKSDGRAALCPTMTEAESPDFAQADLHLVSLQDAWLNHPTFQKYRHVQCRNASVCPTGKRCAGGCRSNAYLLHGTTDSPDEFSCNVFKNGSGEYKEFLEIYRAGEISRTVRPLRTDGRNDSQRRLLPLLG